MRTGCVGHSWVEKGTKQSALAFSGLATICVGPGCTLQENKQGRPEGPPCLLMNNATARAPPALPAVPGAVIVVRPPVAPVVVVVVVPAAPVIVVVVVAEVTAAPVVAVSLMVVVKEAVPIDQGVVTRPADQFVVAFSAIQAGRRGARRSGSRCRQAEEGNRVLHVAGVDVVVAVIAHGKDALDVAGERELALADLDLEIRARSAPPRCGYLCRCRGRPGPGHWWRSQTQCLQWHGCA